MRFSLCLLVFVLYPYITSRSHMTFWIWNLSLSRSLSARTCIILISLTVIRFDKHTHSLQIRNVCACLCVHVRHISLRFGASACSVNLPADLSSYVSTQAALTSDRTAACPARLLDRQTHTAPPFSSVYLCQPTTFSSRPVVGFTAYYRTQTPVVWLGGLTHLQGYTHTHIQTHKNHSSRFLFPSHSHSWLQ